jgi:hypothetical protein
VMNEGRKPSGGLLSLEGRGQVERSSTPDGASTRKQGSGFSLNSEIRNRNSLF